VKASDETTLPEEAEAAASARLLEEKRKKTAAATPIQSPRLREPVAMEEQSIRAFLPSLR
jgi:hypothetical protein